MKFWRLFLCVLLVFIIGGAVAMNAYENPRGAEEDGYKGKAVETVAISSRNLIVNGLVFQDNDYDKYPVLERQGIVYVPLTFHMANLLNVGFWQEERDICLESRVWDSPKPFLFDGYGELNEKESAVNVNSGRIFVNGCQIKIDEPTLTFRDVLYLPVTEQLGETLGWQVRYDKGENVWVECDNYFYMEGSETVYQQGGLRIEMREETNLLGSVPWNLRIVKDGQPVALTAPSEYIHFGHEWELKPMFTVHEGYLFSLCKTEPDAETVQWCRVNIDTGEVELIDGIE